MLPLTQVPAALRSQHSVEITYRQLYLKCLDGRVPAFQEENGRWFIDESDLAATALLLRGKTA